MKYISGLDISLFVINLSFQETEKDLEQTEEYKAAQAIMEETKS